MRKILIPLLLIALPAGAAEEKPLATKIGETVAPYAEEFGKAVNRTMTEYMAGGKGPLAEGARANLKIQEQHEQEANRSVRRTMKECIKPGNIIDDDVKECTEGLRKRTW